MKCSLALLILTIFAFGSYAQENDWFDDSTVTYSESYMPDDFYDSTFFIEKLEELPYHAYLAIVAKESTKTKKDRALEGIEYYNKLAVLKLNQQFEAICANEKKLKVSTVYKSDLEEMPRYTIVSNYDFGFYALRYDNARHAIFDNVTNVCYKSFSSIETLLTATKAAEKYMIQHASRDQSDLDAFMDKKVKRLNRKANGGGADPTLVVAGVLSGILLIAILVTL